MDATSLAIVITQGVVWYCRLVRDAKHDVKELERSALRTQQICRSIEERLEETPDDSKVKKNVQDALEDCRQNIERLEKQLKKSGMGEDRDGWKQKAQEVKNKALYPIRSDGLKKMGDECNTVNEKLFQALQLLSLDRMDEHHNAATKQAELLQLGLEGLKVTAEATSEAISSMRRDATMQEALKWINPLEDHFQLQQRDLTETRALQKAAAQPVIDADIFQEWYTSPSKRLWCHGAPGVGKTILTSILVEYLRDPQNLDSSLAYLYCNYQYEKKFTPRNLIGSIIQQLSHRSPQSRALIVELYERHSYDGTKPSLDELTALLNSVCRNFSRPYILVDGLDEISNNGENLSNFLEQILSLEANFSIMILSRDLPEIQIWLEEWPQLQVEASSEMIKSYLDTYLTKNFRVQRHFKKNAELMPLATQSIVDKADGMFLLARMYVETVVTATTIREFRTMLKTLPSGLNAAYELLLKRIQTQQAASQADLAKRAIMWIACCQVSFSVEQLREAMSIMDQDTMIDDEGMPDEEDIITACMGLLVIREVPGRVRTVGFSHYTAQEFFSNTGASYLDLAQETITLTCLSRLGMKRNIERRDFTTYCIDFWGDHARMSHSTQILEPVVAFLTRPGERFHVRQGNLPIQMATMERSGIHSAASFGLIDAVKQLLDRGHDINAMGLGRIPPIHYAVMNNFAEMTEFLIDNGAMVGTHNEWNLTPLHWACLLGLNDIVRLLLLKGADVNSNAPVRGTPLASAIEGGHISTMRLLLEHSALTTPMVLVGALHESSRAGTLIRRKKTVAHMVVERADIDMLKLLIDWQADLTIEDERGLTPLERATESGREDIALLLKNQKDKVSEEEETVCQSVTGQREDENEQPVPLLVAG